MNDKIMTFEDSVKERLKSIVAELIPEERWNGIVTKTVQEFEHVDLPKMIKDELTDKYKKSISEELSKPEWQSRWDNGNQQASEAINKMLIDAAPLVLASLIGGAAQQVMYDFQARIQNMSGRY